MAESQPLRQTILSLPAFCRQHPKVRLKGAVRARLINPPGASSVEIQVVGLPELCQRCADEETAALVAAAGEPDVDSGRPGRHSQEAS